MRTYVNFDFIIGIILNLESILIFSNFRNMLKFFARSAANAAAIQKLKEKNDNQQKNFERIKAPTSLGSSR